MLLALTLGLAWPSPDEARQASERVLAEPGWQHHLPEGPASPSAPGQSDAPEQPSAAPHGGSEQHPASTPTPQVTTPVGSAVYLALVGGVLAIGLVLVLRARGGRGALPRAATPLAAPPPLEVSARLLDDADTLATEGNFAEAVHTLLLRTFEAFAQQAALPPALTSREILARVPMHPKARQALGELVGAVEITLFGGATADAEDYRRCTDAFRQVLAAEGIRAR